MKRLARTLPIGLALVGSCVGAMLGLAGCQPMPSLDVTESVEQARQLLAIVKAPIPRSLKVVRIAKIEGGKTLSIEFEGDLVVFVDKKTRKPKAYDTGWQGKPMFWWLSETARFGEDDYERGLEKMLNVELSDMYPNSGTGTYMVRGIPTIGIPDLKIEAVFTSGGEIAAISKITNMFTIEVERSEARISVEEAEAIAIAEASKMKERLVPVYNQPGTLYYVPISEPGELPIRVRLVRHIALAGLRTQVAFYVDAETGRILASNRAGEPFDNYDPQVE